MNRFIFTGYCAMRAIKDCLCLWPAARVRPAFVILLLVVSRLFAPGSLAWAEGAFHPSWVKPLIPAKPLPPKSSHGLGLAIGCPPALHTGETLDLKIRLTNNGRRRLLFASGTPPWIEFPKTWCWGPGGAVPTRFLRNVRDGYRHPEAIFARMAWYLLPGKSATLGLPLNYSHIFDLSLPGTYRAQLAGMGTVSNVIRFSVLASKDKPDGPAVCKFAAKALHAIAWGKSRNGYQIAAYVGPHSGLINPIARVRILFRCSGKQPASVGLTGNPHIDFAQRTVIGPFYNRDTMVLKDSPTPLNAYGRLLARRRWRHPPTTKKLTLTPGEVYTYWRPLVLNRGFDLSVYGPYRFSARLHGTALKTAPLIIYVGVQAGLYRHLKMQK